MSWTAPELLAATGGTMAVSFDATGISIDTRTLQPGDLFVALQGETDGYAHVADAFRRGAAGALVHRDTPDTDGPTLRVPDTLLGLQALGRAGRARFQGRMVAVTGSVGKTTTKEMLRTALSAFGPTHAADASYNNHWGVPLTLARLPPDAMFCVAEIGMNHPGEIAPLADMAAPHVALITLIASAHIGHMGSLEAIADEKAALLAALPPDGVAVLPAESPYLERMAAFAPGRVIRTFGTSGLAGVRLLSSTEDVLADVRGTPVRFRLAARGKHMAMNAAAALAVCAALGLDPVRAAAALDGFAPVSGRGKLRVLDGGVTLMDESYNASPASVQAALAVLRELPGRRVAVLGDMLELGRFGPSEHLKLAEAVVRSAETLFACGPLMRHLYDAVPAALRGGYAADSPTLAPLVAGGVQAGDAVLVKGSLGSAMRVVVRALELGQRPGGLG